MGTPVFVSIVTTAGVWLDHATRTMGYGFVYLVKRSLRREALFKMKRSYACMCWLMGLNSVEEAGAR